MRARAQAHKPLAHALCRRRPQGNSASASRHRPAVARPSRPFARRVANPEETAFFVRLLISDLQARRRQRYIE